MDPSSDGTASAPDLSPVLQGDPLDLRRSMTTLTHWAASQQVRVRTMREIDFPVDDVVMFLVVNQLTYRGAMRPTDLSAALGTGRANISKVVRRLEDAGLVTRVGSSLDDRSVLVALSPIGRQYGERILATSQARFDRTLHTWTDEELVLLRRLLGRLARDTATEEATISGWAPEFRDGPS